MIKNPLSGLDIARGVAVVKVSEESSGDWKVGRLRGKLRDVDMRLGWRSGE